MEGFHEQIVCKVCQRQFGYIRRHLAQSIDCKSSYTEAELLALKNESEKITRENDLAKKRLEYDPEKRRLKYKRNRKKLAAQRKKLAAERKRKKAEEIHQQWIEDEKNYFEIQKKGYEDAARRKNENNMKDTYDRFGKELESLKNKKLSDVKLRRIEELEVEIDNTYIKVDLEIDNVVEEMRNYVPNIQLESNKWKKDLKQIIDKLVPATQKEEHMIWYGCWLYSQWHDIQQIIVISSLLIYCRKHWE